LNFNADLPGNLAAEDVAGKTTLQGLGATVSLWSPSTLKPETSRIGKAFLTCLKILIIHNKREALPHALFLSSHLLNYQDLPKPRYEIPEEVLRSNSNKQILKVEARPIK
jgi:hypothetical protein